MSRQKSIQHLFSLNKQDTQGLNLVIPSPLSNAAQDAFSGSPIVDGTATRMLLSMAIGKAPVWLGCHRVEGWEGALGLTKYTISSTRALAIEW